MAAKDYTIKQLREYWETTKSYYAKDEQRMKLLDATDRGQLWKALEAKFPPYQILPDTNFVSYVKNNILASIYTVTKSGEFIPTSEEDKDIITQINIALACIWDLLDVGFYQFQAGERASLLNIGLTQVGWDESVMGGSNNSFYKGNVVIKNLDPMKFRRDPFAVDLDSSEFCVYYDDFHKNLFLKKSKYKEDFKKYLEQNQSAGTETIPEYDHKAARPRSGRKDYHTLHVFWVQDGDKIHEIHTVDLQHILYVREEIKPNCFPIADLYCNLPVDALVGTSECAKIFANNVAFNLMDSISLTAEYKNQRPPKFISSQSGLNVQSFAKHGDEADRTFIVNGDATKAVHYHQFPQVSPTVSNLKQGLQMGIETVSGVDGRYTGRDTGSIITTGGTEEMLNRVTLIDTPKIKGYERYCRKLAYLVIANYIEHSRKRKFFYRKPNTNKWSTVEVDFPKIKLETLSNYRIAISSELPKNKQRIAAVSNMLMEKQMQYQQQGGSVQLITEEEWLMMQDLPMKEFMLERMGIQRLQNYQEDVAQVLFQYSDLVRQGADPYDAILATANSLKNKHMGEIPEEAPVPPVAGGLPQEPPRF